jgi:hypothetical protein
MTNRLPFLLPSINCLIYGALLAVLSTSTAHAQPTSTVSDKPMVVIDRGATWYESRAWGNGATVTLDLPSSSAPGSLSLEFLAGAAPRLTFGCSSTQVKTSYWRLRADFSAPGSIAKISGDAERAYEQGTSHILGVPGVMILSDQSGKVLKQIAVKPTRGGLETAKITDADRQLIVNAIVIRIETPRLVMETKTDKLAEVIDKLSEVPCAAG